MSVSLDALKAILSQANGLEHYRQALHELCDTAKQEYELVEHLYHTSISKSMHAARLESDLEHIRASRKTFQKAAERFREMVDELVAIKDRPVSMNDVIVGLTRAGFKTQALSLVENNTGWTEAKSGEYLDSLLGD